MGPQMQVTREQAVAYKEHQIAEVEKQIEALRSQTQHMKQSADLLRSAETDFETFVKDPGLGNTFLLARGLQKFCKVTRLSTETSMRNMVTHLDELSKSLPLHKEELARIKSPIHTGTLIPPMGIGGKQ